MAHIVADRIRDTTTTTGTGAVTASGTPPATYKTFSARMTSPSDTCAYFIAHRTADEWECGIATYSASNTLTRTTVLSSSNSDAAVSFSAGTKDVVLTQIADRGYQTHGFTVPSNTITVNTPTLDLAQTWNNAAVVFTAFKMNVTKTAFNAGSLLFDIQVGGTSNFYITDSGGVNIPFQPLTAAHLVSTGNISVSGGGYINWSGQSVTLWAEASKIFAIRDGANDQTLRVYNTYTDSSNYERGVFDWTTTANVLTIGSQAGGTGTARSIRINSAGGFVTIASSVNTDQILLGGVAGATGLYISGSSFSAIRVSSNYIFGFSSGSADNTGADIGLYRAAAGVLEINNGSIGNLSYFQWGGQKRVTSDFSVTSSTALTNVTGLSVAVAAGRTYSFQAELFVTDAAAGGVQAAIAGTATATAIQYTGYTVADNAIKGKTNATALGTAVGSTVTTETSGIVVRISGTITVNAAGTLTVQMAQNTSNGTATIAKRGSNFIVHDMP